MNAVFTSSVTFTSHWSLTEMLCFVVQVLGLSCKLVRRSSTITKISSKYIKYTMLDLMYFLFQRNRRRTDAVSNCTKKLWKLKWCYREEKCYQNRLNNASFSPPFTRLFMTTRNPNLELPPDGFAIISEVNFTTTRAGLTGQVNTSNRISSLITTCFVVCLFAKAMMVGSLLSGTPAGEGEDGDPYPIFCLGWIFSPTNFKIVFSVLDSPVCSLLAIVLKRMIPLFSLSCWE